MNIKKLMALFIITVILALLLCFKSEIEQSLTDTASYNEEYITVYLDGEAKITGPFEVPKGWTLGNLIDVIGLTNEADSDSVNTKTVLSENETYTIPRLRGIDEESLININTATKKELMTLPSIGESIAEKIISYRKETPFTKTEDIKNVSGIGDKLYEKIKDLITV